MKLSQKIALVAFRTSLQVMSVIAPQRASKLAFRLFATPMSRFREPDPPVFEKAERLAITLNGQDVQIFRFNKGGKKKIIIHHGFESASANFHQYINRFVKEGWEVLAMDAPAHGKSAGKTITVPLYIQCMQRAEKSYGPFDAFIGHSFGGLVLMHYLEQRAYTNPIHVVLLAAATETTSAIDGFFRLAAIPASLRPSFDEMILELTGHPPGWFSIARIIPSLKAQILWIHDREDRVTPFADVAPIVEKNYAHVRFVLTEGLGHRRIYRQENIVDEVVGFVVGN
jgi:pimeloyl-ACP methyl ester carboxylesterase